VYCGRWRTGPATREGGSEWEPIKFFSKEMATPTRRTQLAKSRLRLNYPSWSRPRSHWSATGPRNQNNNLPNQTHQTHSGNLHNLLPVLHQLDRLLTVEIRQPRALVTLWFVLLIITNLPLGILMM
jgi:hypothetical protein